nr:hypothetical protein [uncultured Campylobacter sp.]
MRTTCNLKFHDSYGAARSDLKFYDKQHRTNFNPARQSGDGCVECNLIYERIADISSHKFSHSRQHGAKFHCRDASTRKI